MLGRQQEQVFQGRRNWYYDGLLARIAYQLGILPEAAMERRRRLLARFRLPIRASEVPVEDMLPAMSLDKKTAGGANRWVLLEDMGAPVVRADVPFTLNNP